MPAQKRAKKATAARSDASEEAPKAAKKAAGSAGSKRVLLVDDDIEIIESMRTVLESRGYDGWYVIEQDTALTDGLPADGEGPIEQVITSMDFLRTVVAPRVSA